MSTTASRSVRIGFNSATDGVEYFQEFPALDFVPSRAENWPADLASGDNTVWAAGTGIVSLTIVPPVNNTVALVLKGDASDTGFTISMTDPTSLSFDESSTNTVIINADDDVTVRIIIC